MPHSTLSHRTRRAGSAKATTENVTTSAPMICVLSAAAPSSLNSVGADINQAPTSALSNRFHGAENASILCRNSEIRDRLSRIAGSSGLATFTQP